ncbi:hypothetical protein MTO96_040309 [Rhipicephalus appendiculatus]
MNFRAGSGDLVLHTYPKSGTHLLLYMAQCILNKGEGSRTYTEFAKHILLLGGMYYEDWRPALPLRLFSTHLPPRRSTMNEQAKYVYLARNPWDVCVSLFHMVTDFSTYRFQGRAPSTSSSTIFCKVTGLVTEVTLITWLPGTL